MWRVQGLVSRVLHRCHANSSLRHVEDEFINSSSALAASRQSQDGSSQKEGDDRRRKKSRTFHFHHSELPPPYTTLDAVRWGAAAVLFVQICRRIHSQFSPGSELAPTPGGGTRTQSVALQKCGYRLLFETLSRNVLPGGRSSSSLLLLSPDPSLDDGNLQASDPDLLTRVQDQSEQTQESLLPEDDSELLESFPLQNDGSQHNQESINADQKEFTGEEKLTAAALNLGHVEDASVSVVLNIMGLEQARRGNHEEAFHCFLAAAQKNYCKAQFNTAVCFERGRGVQADMEKARLYYEKAAKAGHGPAQYRFAKLLLKSRSEHSLEELTTVVGFLEKASSAGLTKAQVCLASICSEGPLRDECKSLHYLQMAAESGDDTALLLLGQCYERGFGVSPSPRTAMDFYRRAAKAGNAHARTLLRVTGTKDALLRSIQSSPCFLPSDRVTPVTPVTSVTSGLPFLPHSWSAGNVCGADVLTSVSLHLRPRGRSCGWTVGAE